VDANSPDDTGKIVKEKMKKYKNLHLLSKEKGGLGADYIAGFKYAWHKLHADAVMEMDADFQHPPRFVAPMVEAYLGGADYVIGSRYIPGGSVPSEWAASRKAISFFGNLFIRLVWLSLKLHDLTTGFRLTKVEGVLDKIKLDKIREQKRFAYKVDLLYQSIKNAKNIREVPLQFASRTMEQSKFNFKEMIVTFKLAIIIGIEKKIRFIKFAVVGFIGFIVNALGIEIFRRMGFTNSLAELSAPFIGVPVLQVFTTPTSWAAALGAELAIMSNFTLNNIWTFAEKRIGLGEPRKLIKKFLEFNFTSLGAIVIQFGVVGGAVVALGDTAIIRQLALVAAIVFFIIPYNYTMYNFFIWKTWKIPGTAWLQKMMG
jgi:dolichol-phosphate mannosyltransferase